MTKQELFGDIDFKTLADNPDFKEDSVREMIILPILKKLGYSEEHIIRSKTLEHPFLKIGSNKNIPVRLIPDYVIKVDDFYPFVLDAKSPKQKIVNDYNVEQVYSYAMHSEIRSNYFALCNGIEFSLYSIFKPREPVLFFKLENFEDYWEILKRYLSIESQVNIDTAFPNFTLKRYEREFDYLNRPTLKEIPVKKQATKRHFGVHGYFTSQAWNVVQTYIRHYTQPGDLVLDPFGGKGVTAIEAMMTERNAITVDLNPMAVFITQSLIAPVNFHDFHEAFEKIKTEYLKLEPKTNAEVSATLKKYEKQLPKDLQLPKSSDVKSVWKLFTKKQLAQLALLKSLIKKQKDKNIKASFMLVFSGLISKANLTVHSNENLTEGKKAQGGFDCGPFRYYRYRIAHSPKQLDIFKYFESRYKRIVEAKKDIEYYINKHTIENIEIRKGTATDLSFIEDETVDYIYTDPPYGKKIPYLDLSTMWNAWLDLDVKKEDFDLEAIEGGEQNKSKQEYKNLIADSIKEMYRVLKFDRWMSFVFAHKDPDFWDLIITTAQNCGFEYYDSVSQKNGHKSFKKIQKPFAVLSGQLIMNFRKVRNPKVLMKANLGMNIYEILTQTIEGIIAKNNGANFEQINDEIILRGLELRFLDLMKKESIDLSKILTEKFDYDAKTELYQIRKDSKITFTVPVENRIKYYLVSFLGRMEREEKTVTFDDIVLYVMPLLRNGTTPEGQTILNVLESIAVKVGKDGWKLSNGELF